MSLRWSVTNCHEWEKLDQQKTHEVVWSTMSVDIGRITEENHVQFYRRVKMLQDLVQVCEGITFEDIKARIGMTTNCLTRSDANFKKKVLDAYFEQLDSHINKCVGGDREENFQLHPIKIC